MHDTDELATPSDRVVQLVRTKSEADVAAELKAKVAEAFKVVCAAMDEAASHGFAVRWAAFAPNMIGRHEVVDLHLIKRV